MTFFTLARFVFVGERFGAREHLLQIAMLDGRFHFQHQVSPSVADFDDRV
jgi:hypothetical protein